MREKFANLVVSALLVFVFFAALYNIFGGASVEASQGSDEVLIRQLMEINVNMREHNRLLNEQNQLLREQNRKCR